MTVSPRLTGRLAGGSFPNRISGFVSLFRVQAPDVCVQNNPVHGSAPPGGWGTATRYPQQRKIRLDFLEDFIVRTKFVLHATAVCAAIGAAPAGAQFQAIPCEIVSGQALTGEQNALISSFTSEWSGRLDASEMVERLEARDMLLRPFNECDDVSVAFRVAMGKALQDRLSQLVRSDDERVVYDACQIAGRIGSSETMAPLNQAIRDERASVRAGAAVGFREMLESVSTGNNAVGQSAVSRAMSGLLNATRSESNPVVAEMFVHTFSGTQLDSAMHVQSMGMMAEGVYDLAKTARRKSNLTDQAEWDHAFFAAADTAYQSTLKLQIERVSPGEFGKQAGLMSGQIYAWSRSRLEELGTEAIRDTEEGRAVTELVEAADSLLQISHRWIAPGSTPPSKVKAAWDEAVAEDAPGRFDAALEPIIGAGGLLTKPPYNGSASDFR